MTSPQPGPSFRRVVHRDCIATAATVMHASCMTGCTDGLAEDMHMLGASGYISTSDHALVTKLKLSDAAYGLGTKLRFDHTDCSVLRKPGLFT